MQNSLVFITSTAPNPAKASAAIFYRHLVFLEKEGWQIHLICPESEKNKCFAKQTWKILFLPNRKFWWPPFRPYGILSRIRYQLLAAECKTFVRNAKASVFLGYMWGNYFSGFAAYLSRRFSTPLGIFYHDDTELFPDMVSKPRIRAKFRKLKSKIFEQASIVWAVSPCMIKRETLQSKIKLLYPLSENVQTKTPCKWHRKIKNNPIIIHAGTIYPEIIPPLIDMAKVIRNLGGKLILLTHTLEQANSILRKAGTGVEIKPALPGNEAVRWVRKNAAATVVMYPENVEEMPWIRTNFPSKFCQFTATGLPTLIFAPEGSALRRWAQVKNYPMLLPAPSSQMFSKAVRRFFSKNIWEDAAKKSWEAWQGEFNPKKIHQQIVLDLNTIKKQKTK